MIEGKDRLKWNDAIRTASLSASVREAVDESDFAALSILLRDNNDMLVSCKSPGIFLDAASALADSDKSDASAVLLKLLNACPAEWDIRLGIFYSLKKVQMPSETLAALDDEESRKNLSSDYKKKLAGIRLSVLKDQLAAAPPDSDEVEKLAKEILKLNPADRDALSSIAWWNYRNTRYHEAYEGFSALHLRYPEKKDYEEGMVYALMKLKKFDQALEITSRYPNDDDFVKLTRDINGEQANAAYNDEEYEKARELYSDLHRRFPDVKDYTVGLAYTLIKLKRPDEALEVARSYKGHDEDIAKLEAGVYQQKAGDAYAAGNYEEADGELKHVLALDPGNTDAKALMAWSLFNEKRGKEALPIFTALFEARNDPALAGAIMNIYDTSGHKKEAALFAENIALSDQTELRKIAADYFFNNNRPLHAAETFSGTDTCYYNADTPFADISPNYRRKSGSKGFSMLDEYNLPASFHYVLSDTEIGFSFTAHRLLSGAVEPNPFAGSYYKNIPQINELVTSAVVYTPEIKLMKESPGSTYSLMLGSTPLNGVISPVPVFSAAIAEKTWTFGIHQTSVEESILAYAGLKDPYGDGKWGRVVKTGFEGEYKIPGLDPFWLSLKGAYDFYHGENVIDNPSYQGTLSFGRTLSTSALNISPGMYVNGQHFDHNTNFFTFGHGGYYSPQTYYVTGPFVNLQTKNCGSYVAQAQFGVNYYSAKTDSVLFYPVGKNTGETYAGATTSGLGYTANGGGYLLLSDHLMLGGTAGVNKSNQYTEVKAGLVLRYFFKSRYKLSQKDVPL